jgi:hypothetical protein
VERRPHRCARRLSLTEAPTSSNAIDTAFDLLDPDLKTCETAGGPSILVGLRAPLTNAQVSGGPTYSGRRHLSWVSRRKCCNRSSLIVNGRSVAKVECRRSCSTADTSCCKCLRLQCHSEFTGTRITSDKGESAFSGHDLLRWVSDILPAGQYLVFEGRSSRTDRQRPSGQPKTPVANSLTRSRSAHITGQPRLDPASSSCRHAHPS